LDLIVWTWDGENARVHLIKHKVSFGLAVRVFDDPFQLSEPDPHPDGDRWRTLGLVGDVVLLVVHTDPVAAPVEGEAEPVMGGRIISARKATRLEREKYADQKF
jgi:uncharacterized DUF497 family protein